MRTASGVTLEAVPLEWILSGISVICVICGSIRSALHGEVETECLQPLRGGDAVPSPAAEIVELVEHPVEFLGRAVHPFGRAVGDRLMLDAPGKGVVLPRD